jgi:hypothetical protein
MAYAARRLTRRVTWYLSLGPTRLAVDVQGVETITADDPLTVRAQVGPFPSTCGARATARFAPSPRPSRKRGPTRRSPGPRMRTSGGVRAMTTTSWGISSRTWTSRPRSAKRFPGPLTTTCRICSRRTFEGRVLCAECEALLWRRRPASPRGRTTAALMPGSTRSRTCTFAGRTRATRGCQRRRGSSGWRRSSSRRRAGPSVSGSP